MKRRNAIETNLWYKIPYHATVNFARDINDNAIYLESSYRGPATTKNSQSSGSAR